MIPRIVNRGETISDIERLHSGIFGNIFVADSAGRSGWWGNKGQEYGDSDKIGKLF